MIDTRDVLTIVVSIWDRNIPSPRARLTAQNRQPLSVDDHTAVSSCWSKALLSMSRSLVLTSKVEVLEDETGPGGVCAFCCASTVFVAGAVIDCVSTGVFIGCSAFTGVSVGFLASTREFFVCSDSAGASVGFCNSIGRLVGEASADVSIPCCNSVGVPIRGFVSTGASIGCVLAGISVVCGVPLKLSLMSCFFTEAPVVPCMSTNASFFCCMSSGAGP